MRFSDNLRAPDRLLKRFKLQRRPVRRRRDLLAAGFGAATAQLHSASAGHFQTQVAQVLQKYRTDIVNNTTERIIYDVKITSPGVKPLIETGRELAKSARSEPSIDVGGGTQDHHKLQKPQRPEDSRRARDLECGRCCKVAVHVRWEGSFVGAGVRPGCGQFRFRMTPAPCFCSIGHALELREHRGKVALVVLPPAD